MASNRPHGGGLLTEPEAVGNENEADPSRSDQVSQDRQTTAGAPAALVFEAPDWMKSYGMPLAISCSVGYSLVGLVMVEPTAPGMMFHPAAVLTLFLFALGFVKGMQWWTTANESGKALVCPHCGLRTRREALTPSIAFHTCTCGREFSAI
jgi:hypothetical protein